MWRSLLEVEALYRRYAPMVYRRCLRLLGNPERAREAMQDVFINILKNHSTLDLAQAPSSLLYQMATRVSLNLIRSSRRRPEVSDSDLLYSIIACEEEEERLVRNSLAAKILGRHDQKTALMAVMHFVDGMTLEEVASEFSMSVSGIRKRLKAFKTMEQEKEPE